MAPKYNDDRSKEITLLRKMDKIFEIVIETKVVQAISCCSHTLKVIITISIIAHNFDFSALAKFNISYVH